MEKHSILVVEDEPSIREIIKMALSKHGFTLFLVETVSQARDIFNKENISLVILDWMLPKTQGTELIKEIRENYEDYKTAIIMLTAKAEENNKIKCFSLGVDDYITKPFSPKELVCRVQSILRRGIIVNKKKEVLYEKIKINLDTNKVYINNTLVKISNHIFKLLVFFIRHSGKTYTRSQLIDHVWGKNIFIDERSVDVQIKRLRHILKNHGCINYIVTIRGVGYQWTNS